MGNLQLTVMIKVHQTMPSNSISLKKVTKLFWIRYKIYNFLIIKTSSILVQLLVLYFIISDFG